MANLNEALNDMEEETKEVTYNEEPTQILSIERYDQTKEA